MKAFEMQEDWSVYFTKDDGTQFEARVIASFSVSNPKFKRNTYCALYSPEFNPKTDEPIVLFRVDLTDGVKYAFHKVTDREEAEAMFQSWTELIDSVQNNQIEGVDLYGEPTNSSRPNQ